MLALCGENTAKRPLFTTKFFSPLFTANLKLIFYQPRLGHLLQIESVRPGQRPNFCLIGQATTQFSVCLEISPVFSETVCIVWGKVTKVFFGVANT